MKKSASGLTKEDGAEFVLLMNEASEISQRTVAFDDLYLHYRVGVGWRARFLTNEAGTKNWISDDGPWTGLVDAVRAQVNPIRRQLEQNDRLAAQRQQRVLSKHRPRKKT